MCVHAYAQRVWPTSNSLGRRSWPADWAVRPLGSCMVIVHPFLQSFQPSFSAGLLPDCLCSGWRQATLWAVGRCTPQYSSTVTHVKCRISKSIRWSSFVVRILSLLMSFFCFHVKSVTLVDLASDSWLAVQQKLYLQMLAMTWCWHHIRSFMN